MRLRPERAAGALRGDRLYAALRTGLTPVTQSTRAASVAMVLTRLSPWLDGPTLVAIAIQFWADAIEVRVRFSHYRVNQTAERFAGYLQGLLAAPENNAELRLYGAARWLITRWRRVRGRPGAVGGGDPGCRPLCALGARERAPGGCAAHAGFSDVTAALLAAGPAGAVVADLGLETPLTTRFEGGRDLSGGQALALARGLFARGDRVVFDEPTAALDPLAEQEICARFARIAKGRLAALITHRMAAAALAQEIVVLHRGRV